MASPSSVLSDGAVGILEGASAEVLGWTRGVADELERDLRATNARPHRAFARPISEARGLAEAEASVIDGVLDLLQIAFDLADNLADHEQDLADGVDHLSAYTDIPRASLHALPAYLTSAASCALASRFPAPRNGNFAAARLLRVLDRMMVGQSYEGRAKIFAVAGNEGLLLALPHWVSFRHEDPEDARRLEALELWATRFGATWEYEQMRRASPTDPWLLAEMRSLYEWVEEAWPTYAPFMADQPLSTRFLLPRVLAAPSG